MLTYSQYGSYNEEPIDIDGQQVEVDTNHSLNGHNPLYVSYFTAALTDEQEKTVFVKETEDQQIYF